MIEIDTKKQVEVIDITSLIEKAVEGSKVDRGICFVFALHTTTGIIINEAEMGLIDDFAKLLQSLAPKGAGYLHDRIDSNAHAHLQAVLLGNCAALPLEGGKLTLGRWQRILFIELDGPRHRRICVRAISEQMHGLDSAEQG